MENTSKWGYSDPRLPMREDLEREIDVLYDLHNTLRPGDRALYEGTHQYSLLVECVSQGLILVVYNTTITDLHQQEQLTALQRANYAGFGPALLKSKYGVSNLLKRLLTDLGCRGINLFNNPIYTLQQ